MQIIQMIRNGQNPQQLVMDMMKQQFQGNPMGANLINMAQQGDTAQIEQFARNLVASQGKDFDQEFSAFKQSLGL